MTTGNIEFVQGSEQHTSFWGKYYVKGLEFWQTKEDFTENISSKHEYYQGYVCLDVPAGTIFTVFEQSGNKRGTEIFSFMICITTGEEVGADKALYGNGKTTGNFKIVAHGKTKTTGPRLLGWWDESDQKDLAFAQHCAANLSKRGLKILPPMAA